jgi:hypothetical protein
MGSKNKGRTKPSFVKLNDLDGDEILVNVLQITTIQAVDGGKSTDVFISGDEEPLAVKEKPQQILDKI